MGIHLPSTGSAKNYDSELTEFCTSTAATYDKTGSRLHTLHLTKIFGILYIHQLSTDYILGMSVLERDSFSCDLPLDGRCILTSIQLQFFLLYFGFWVSF